MDNLNITGRSGRKSGRIGGGRSVFDQVHNQSRISNGAIIMNPPAVGGVIFEGDLGQYDYYNNAVIHLRVYILAKELKPTDTEVVVMAGEYNHPLVTGANLVVESLDWGADGSGSGVKVGAITNETLPNGNKVVKFAISAGAFGTKTHPVGVALIEADKVGSGAIPKVLPNVAFTTDIPIDQVPSTSPLNEASYEGYTYYAPLFNECTIIAARATYVPYGVRKALRSGYSDIKIFG